MAGRIDKSWVVFESVENDEHNRCVDFFQRTDGTWGFEEFRRDAEDAGKWTPVAGYSDAVYPTKPEAKSHARRAVVWFAVLG